MQNPPRSGSQWVYAGSEFFIMHSSLAAGTCIGVHLKNFQFGDGVLEGVRSLAGKPCAPGYSKRHELVKGMH